MAKLFGKRAEARPEPAAARLNEDAYLAARREWNERYGSYRTRAATWRAFAFLMAATALVLGMALWYVAMQRKVIPYVVEVDRIGQAVAVRQAETQRPVDNRVVKAMLARFIVDTRSVLADGIAQRQAIDRIYALLAGGARATSYMNEYFQRENPFERAKATLVSVEIISTLPQTDKTWLVEWEETTRDGAGQVMLKNRWKAFLTVAFNPPTDEQQIRINPLGIFVVELNWAQTL